MNSDLLLESSYSIDHLLEPVIAEQLVFLVLEKFSDGVVLVFGNQLVACTTGNYWGSSALRILPTYTPAWRKIGP